MVDVSADDRLTSLGRQGLPRTSLAEDVDVMRRPVVGPVAMAMVLLGCQSHDDYHPDAVAVKQGDVAIDGGRFEHFDTAIPGWLRAYDVPSAAVSVVENGEIVWSGVYGQQSPTMPASEQTLYLTASIAEPVTGEVALRLASRGDIALDEPMAPHWLDPHLADDSRALRLTPRHVLTHQTGFKNWRYMTDGILRFEWAPGDAVGYSGEGFQYLVRFVERKLNRPFNDIAQELLFVPAGMGSSAMARQDWYDGRLAWPLLPDGEWREPRSSDEARGAGGMRTTSQDYAKFIISILNGDGVSTELRDERLRISRNQHERCVDGATRPGSCPAQLGFGLSWYVYEFDDETIVAHSGANAGERTLVVFSPSRRAALVVMTNGANGDQVIYEIADAVGVHKDFLAIERPRVG